MKVLSIGSGKQEKEDGLTRLDISAETNPDVVWDLNNFPYPFEDQSYDLIECYDVIEHIDSIPKVMEQCHRILKKGGVIKLTTPHFSSANSYIDPTHKFHLSYFSFDCFSDQHEYSYYSKARFKILKRDLRFNGNRLYRAIFYRVAKHFPKFYETRLTWIFPAWFLYFELEAIHE